MQPDLNLIAGLQVLQIQPNTVVRADGASRFNFVSTTSRPIMSANSTISATDPASSLASASPFSPQARAALKLALQAQEHGPVSRMTPPGQCQRTIKMAFKTVGVAGAMLRKWLAAVIGPTVWELEGPKPTLKSSSKLVFIPASFDFVLVNLYRARSFSS